SISLSTTIHAAHRQNVARIVSSVRLVRHMSHFTVSCMRASPSLIVALFRDHRHLTSPALTKIQLEKGERWLDVFKAEQGDVYLHHLRMRRIVEMLWFVSFPSSSNARNSPFPIVLEHRLSTAPFHSWLFKPSVYTGPFQSPLLKPQPDHISGMIHNAAPPESAYRAPANSHVSTRGPPSRRPIRKQPRGGGQRTVRALVQWAAASRCVRDATRAMKANAAGSPAPAQAARREKIANKHASVSARRAGKCSRSRAAGRASRSLRTCWSAVRTRCAGLIYLRDGVRARSDT
ncbi:hypothetical protein BC826DRAFT_1057242, partial [Russula brevipes]